MKNKKKIKYLIAIIISVLIISYIYLSFPIIIMPDSTEYYGYLKIFYNIESFSNWNIVRGPSLPTILYIITITFSNSSMGLLLGTYFFYLILILTGIIIIHKINCAKKILIYLLYGILIVLNPILIGYMHGLLTEFSVMPIMFISALVALLWIKSNKKSACIFLSILIILGSIFLWFLKQPYLFLWFGPVIVASIISSLENRKIKNILYRIIIMILCIIGIIGANKVWNFVLTNNNVNMNTGRDTNSFLKESIINGNTATSVDFYEEHYNIDYIMHSELIDEADKLEIMKIAQNDSNYKSFKLINIYGNFRSREEENIIKKYVLFSENENYTIADAIKMWGKILIKHPTKSIKAYILNYCAIADVVPSMRHKDANVYYPSLTDGFYFENYSIGSSIYYTEGNMLWLNEDHYLWNNVKNLETTNDAPHFLKTIGIKSFGSYNFIYKIAIMILPFALAVATYKTIRTQNNKQRTILELSLLLLGGAFIHLLLHTVTGAIIDRYGFVAFPAIVVGILIIMFEEREEIKVTKIDSNKTKGEKTITIIPAHNEAHNIQKVLDELKSDFPETDILVINDSSTDKTKEIVNINGIKCITTVFNLNYAYAVQTGIKYAKKHNYDYCIMFDGDGQHIAKEAKKLLEQIKETNCDIVIGSRYMEKGNYNAPILRKIGTSIFTWLIRISCKKTITDPLSGFQIINRGVIEKYSKIGEYPEFPDANLIIEMLLEGYTISEVSVKMRNREFGESMHGGIIKPIKYMIVMLYTITILILNKIFRRKK